MIRTILVPLDGSKMAESILPAAAALAGALEASVVLLHILERNPPKNIHGDTHLQSAAEARRYLHEIALRFFPPEVSVRAHVHVEGSKDVAGSISAHTAEIDFDMVVMCVHGRHALRNLQRGFLAQQLVSRTIAPVLVFRAEELSGDRTFLPASLLLPLDRMPGHDRSLAFTRDLSRAWGARVVLLTVVPTFFTLTGRLSAASRLLPGTTYQALAISKEGAYEYLSGIQRSLEAEGLSVTSIVLRGYPSRTILRAARKHACDLLVLCTHGRVGTEAFWADSVASRVCRRAHLPCLLVPASRRKRPE
jgi:nucleotide-binding universal stress UspA family protein